MLQDAHNFWTCSAFRLKCQNANRTEWTQEPMVYKISPVSRWTCCRWTFSSAMPMLIRSNQQSTTSIIYYRKSVSRIPVECAGKKRSLKIPAEWNTSLLKYHADNCFQYVPANKHPQIITSIHYYYLCLKVIDTDICMLLCWSVSSLDSLTEWFIHMVQS